MLLQKGTLELTYILNRLLKCLSMTLCTTTKTTQDGGQFMWQRCIFFKKSILISMRNLMSVSIPSIDLLTLTNVLAVFGNRTINKQGLWYNRWIDIHQNKQRCNGSLVSHSAFKSQCVFGIFFNVRAKQRNPHRLTQRKHHETDRE